MGLFDKAKQKLQEKVTVDSIGNWLNVNNDPEGEHSEKQIKDAELLGKQLQAKAIVGGEYPCRKNKKVKRVSAGKGIKYGSKVTIERYTYQGRPAYMVVNPKTGLDIGVLSAGTAEALAKKTNAKILQGEIVDSFVDAAGVKNWTVYFEA